MQELRRVHGQGKLPPAAALFMADRKPVEELYDLEQDPHEVRNLAASARHKEVLERMREVHLQWVLETRDLGLVPEPEIVRLEKKLGSRYAILRQPGAEGLMRRIRDTASLALQGPEAVGKLAEALKDGDATVRYWAAVGLRA